MAATSKHVLRENETNDKMRLLLHLPNHVYFATEIEIELGLSDFVILHEDSV